MVLPPPAAWPRFVSWIVVPVVGLAGLAVLLSPLSARHRARRTAYVITDRRALLVRVGWGSRVYSYERTALHELQVRELEDGRGEVIFEEKVRIRIRTDDSGSEQRHTHVVGFLEVAPVEPARRALEEMLGRPVTAQRIQSMSLNQHHPI